MQIISHISFQTPLGLLDACATNEGICMLEYSDRKGIEKEFDFLRKMLNAEIEDGDNQHLQKLDYEIREYFNGVRKEFSVPIVMAGSDFQKQVWSLLLKIPYGKTRTYLDQAKAFGNPETIRAIAHANGQNMIAIVIPCHRVIGSDGKLTGYGGGLWRKKWLLELEQGLSLKLWQ